MSLRGRSTLIAAAAAAIFCLQSLTTTVGQARADFRLGVDEPDMSAIQLAPSDWTPLIQQSGASIVRRFIYWSQIAPTRPENPANPSDPAYNWRYADQITRIAAVGGAEVLFSMYSAPPWAEGPNRPTTGYGQSGSEAPYPGSWKPDPAALGQFAEALAKRYDGTTTDPLDPSGKTKLPRVRLFEAWNEANYKMFLTPQCSTGQLQAQSTCPAGSRLVVVDHYRQMINQFYDGVNRGQPNLPDWQRPLVAAGGLGPYGSSSQGPEIDPQVFARQLMCLGGTAASPRALSGTACPVKAKMDALSFHPYTFTGTPTTKAASPDGGALGNAPDLQKALTLATTAKTILPSPGQPGYQSKELWETETGWLTCPPCRPTANPNVSIGINVNTAAAYTGEMIYRAWSWGVRKLVWFGAVDDGDQTGSKWPGGLYYQCAEAARAANTPCQSPTLADAVPKPGLQAFRFPVFSAKSGGKAFIWAMSPCKVTGSTLTYEALNSKTKAWTQLTVPGPIDPKTRKPTIIPLKVILPFGTDGTAKTPLWAIPANTSAVRAVASGGSCKAERSISVAIAPS